MFGTLEHRKGGPTLVAIGGLTRLPLWNRGGAPLPSGLRGICRDGTSTPDRRDPGGDRAGLQVVIPGRLVERLGLDQILAE